MLHLHVVKVFNFMASSGGSKAIELVTTGQYHAIAACIDNLELQVRACYGCIYGVHFGMSRCVSYVQVTYRAELDQRPELPTLQLLGHIYNGDL